MMQQIVHKSTPEDPHNLMDSYPKDNVDEQELQEQRAIRRKQGSDLRQKVALGCWSFEPDRRPSMDALEEMLGTLVLL